MIYIEARGKTIKELVTAIGEASGDTRILAGRLSEPLFNYNDAGSKEIWDLTVGAYFCGVPVVDHIPTVGLCR